MATRTCRFQGHVAICAAIADDIRSVPECPLPARHVTAVVIATGGIEIQLRTDLCDEHSQIMSTARAFLGSEPIPEAVSA